MRFHDGDKYNNRTPPPCQLWILENFDAGTDAIHCVREVVPSAEFPARTAGGREEGVRGGVVGDGTTVPFQDGPLPGAGGHVREEQRLGKRHGVVEARVGGAALADGRIELVRVWAWR